MEVGVCGNVARTGNKMVPEDLCCCRPLINGDEEEEVGGWGALRRSSDRAPSPRRTERAAISDGRVGGGVRRHVNERGERGMSRGIRGF